MTKPCAVSHVKFPVEVRFTQREIDWLNNYGGNHELTLEAAVRHAVRLLSLVDGTPGAMAAVRDIANAHIGPKYQPMEPLPEVQS